MPTRRQIELIKEAARDLRKRQTPSEARFWNAVRGRKLKGRKFYRQYTLWVDYQGQERFFITDFYCHECGLVVEIDGGIHARQQDRDELRTYLINQLGIRVMRVKNEELEDLPGVLEKVAMELTPGPLSSQERGSGLDRSEFKPASFSYGGG